MVYLNSSFIRDVFDGDLYRLKQRYGQIDLPDYPAVNMDFPATKLDSMGSKYDYQFDVSVKKDHIIYDLTVDHVHQAYPFSYTEPTAHYRPGNNKLQTDILAECNHSVPLQDTVFIFQGIVNRNGIMTNTELVVGTSSIFTESIINWLQKPENLWRPQTQGGTPVRSLVDVFIRIRDGQILSVSSSGWKRKKIVHENYITD